jgi:hypothetical protein
MHELAEIDETFVFPLIGILLLMAIWGCAVRAIDHWAWEGRTENLHA